jgi:uncharacterized protein
MSRTMKLKWKSDGQTYRMLKADLKAAGIMVEQLRGMEKPFTVIMIDEDEVTLVAQRHVVERIAARASDTVISDVEFRLITFDMVFDFGVVGFMARVSTALAQAQVPIFPYAAYTTDHILVPAAHYENAIAALEKLMENE